MKLQDLSGPQTVRVSTPVAWATADTEGEEPVFVAPYNIKIVGARFLSKAAITADGTNHSVITLKNKGAAGSGTTAIASHAFDTTTTDDLAAYTEVELTLSATAANLLVSAGHAVTAHKTTPGTGIALTGVIEIDFVPAAVV